MAHRTHTHTHTHTRRKANKTQYKKRDGIYKSTMACIAQQSRTVQIVFSSVLNSV